MLKLINLDMFYSSFDRIVCTRLELYYDFMYRIIILCFSYLATWLPFLNKPIDWLIDCLFSCIRFVVFLYRLVNKVDQN